MKTGLVLEGGALRTIFIAVTSFTKIQTGCFLKYYSMDKMKRKNIGRKF